MNKKLRAVAVAGALASPGYVNLKNDVAGTYDLMGGSGTGTGAKSSAVAVSIAHRF